jgi:quercetin dioxygenase-like cupin family protein
MTTRKGATRYRLADQKRVSGSPLGFHHGVPGESVNFLRAELKAGFSFPMHTHPNEQFTYVLSGKSRISFADGAPPITLEAGEVINIPPEVPHDITVLEDTIQIEIFAPPRNSLVEEMAPMPSTAKQSGT